MNCYIAVRLTASQILYNSFKVKAQQAALSVQKRHPFTWYVDWSLNTATYSTA
jgi:hypothetical protein